MCIYAKCLELRDEKQEFFEKEQIVDIQVSFSPFSYFDNNSYLAFAATMNYSIFF